MDENFVVSMLAISIVMTAFFGFGWWMHKEFIKIEKKSGKTPETPERHGCDTCKHEKVGPREDPCFECANGITDKWERKE